MPGFVEVVNSELTSEALTVQEAPVTLPRVAFDVALTLIVALVENSVDQLWLPLLIREILRELLSTLELAMGRGENGAKVLPVAKPMLLLVVVVLLNPVVEAT